MDVVDTDAADAAHASRRSPMEALSDEALLGVLQHLPALDLLRARAVCRRWRGAALHPQLWRRRSFTWRRPAGRLVRTALRLAPCLARLAFVDGLEGGEVVGAMLCSCRCAVAELELRLSSSMDLLVAGCVVRRQAALGRLQTLTVMVDCQRVSGFFAECMLYILLGAAPGLRVLRLSFIGAATPSPAGPRAAPLTEPPPPSLRTFSYSSTHRGPEPHHLEFLLRAHAHTLEEVNLRNLQSPCGLQAVLFAGMPSLRELECPLLEDMRPLLQAPRLRSLALYPGGAPRSGYSLSDAELFFRKATALAELHAYGWSGEHSRTLADLVFGLSALGRSALRTLSLGADSVRHVSLMNLSGLTRLRAVAFRRGRGAADDEEDCIPTAFWKTLAQEAVPALRIVRGGSLQAGCVHRFMSSPLWNKVVDRHPRLHLLTRHRRCFSLGDRGGAPPCDVCAEEGESFAGSPADGARVGLCDHGEEDDDACDVEEHVTVDGVVWFYTLESARRQS